MFSLGSKTGRSVIREGDILVRYGGEEFLAILPTPSKADVAKIRERLRRLVEGASPIDQEHAVRVTICMGGTSYSEVNAADESDLVKADEKSLYTAKESGRNQVILAY
jgi:diguanylate cyclase (GGDEF)-like protein